MEYVAGLAEQKSKHSVKTKQWASLAEKDFSQFLKAFSGSEFKGYHQELLNARQGWYSWSFLETSLRDQINVMEKAKLTIADCGCGMNGLFKWLQRSKNAIQQEKMIHIYGFDVDEQVRELEKESTKNLKFNFIKGDMCPEQNIPKFDVILYCLSFWQSDVTRHMDWASSQLSNNGILYIVQNLSRLPSDRNEILEGYGFQCINVSPYGHHHLFSFRKQDSLTLNKLQRKKFIVNSIGDD